MQLPLRIALIIITLIYVAVILNAVKHKKMPISYLIFWLFTGLVLIVILAVPGLINMISSFLGFEVPANMMFCFSIFISFYLIFSLNIRLAKEYKNNVNLIQEISMLKKKVEELEKKEK